MDAPPTVAITASPPAPAEVLTVSVNPVAAAPREPAPASPLAAGLATTWPRSAQLTTAFLLGLAIALLGLNLLQSSRGWTRPAELRYRAVEYRIDLNEAPHAELLQLPGVGEHLARRIETQRPFRRVDDLLQVQGIGPVTLERLRPWVQVRPAETGGEEPEGPVNRSARSRSKANSATGKEPAAVTIKGGKAANLTEPIDINRATAEELQRLPGVGPRISQRIVDEREKGRFKSVEDLRRVSGIGPKILERLRPYVTVDSPTGLPSRPNKPGDI
jgi:comEA protein